MVKGIQTRRGRPARWSTPAPTPSSCPTTAAASSTARPIPLRVLPDVVDAVGDRAEVCVDGGIMSGADVVAAVALGAAHALVGRAYLYGLMAGGERGVDRAAEILVRGGPPHHATARRAQRRRPRTAARATALTGRRDWTHYGRHWTSSSTRRPLSSTPTRSAARPPIRRIKPGTRAAAVVGGRVRRRAAQRRRPVQREGRPAFRQPADRAVLRRGRRARRHAGAAPRRRWSRPATGPRRPRSRSSAA